MKLPTAVALALVSCCFNPAIALDEPAKPEKRSKLHTPAEIFDILEKSSVVYELDVDKDIATQPTEKGRVLSDYTYLKSSADGASTLTTLPLSPDGNRVLKEGLDAFEKKDYEKALKLYTKVHEMDPEYHHALTLIGDIHYFQGDLKEAMSWFEKAIDRSFADYAAHWFLADALWKTGKRGEAVRRMTTAHLFNVNHQMMRDRLAAMRKEIKRPWNDWTFSPRYRVEKVEGKVKVVFQEDWMPYAIVKAVWAHEPGYKEATAGPDYEKLIVCMEEEKEGLLAMYVVHGKDKEFKTLRAIIDGGYISEMIDYEIMAGKAPEAIVLMPRDSFTRLVEYVDRFH
jgi:tetratricopeptide (TPR) repeat protein